MGSSVRLRTVCLLPIRRDACANSLLHILLIARSTKAKFSIKRYHRQRRLTCCHVHLEWHELHRVTETKQERKKECTTSASYVLVCRIKLSSKTMSTTWIRWLKLDYSRSSGEKITEPGCIACLHSQSNCWIEGIKPRVHSCGRDPVLTPFTFRGFNRK